MTDQEKVLLVRLNGVPRLPWRDMSNAECIVSNALEKRGLVLAEDIGGRRYSRITRAGTDALWKQAAITVDK